MEDTQMQMQTTTNVQVLSGSKKAQRVCTSPN
jgi:hypothetical protein